MTASRGGEGVLELRGSGSAQPGRVRILLASDALVLGEFRCRAGDPLWATENSIGDLPHVVWPITTVEITRKGLGRVCGDRNGVVLYDAGAAYRRHRVSPAGDRSVFIAVHPELLDRLAGRPARRGRFPVGHLPLPAGGWLRKERAVSAARARQDPMRLEELALRALGAVVQALSPLATDRPRRGRALRDRVEDARLLLGEDLSERVLLTDVARRLEVSPFHLARQFRELTGASMHHYRLELRARAAAQIVLEHPTRDLSRIAAEHGFASHSHLTSTCRRLLGRTPSALRRDVLAEREAAP